MESKRINRNDKFCSSVRKKDVGCVLSGCDSIQCEAAHIVPLNGEYGQVNYNHPELLNDSANGMLLSKELHYLYDSFIWCISPENYKEIDGIPKKRKYNIEIASSYKDKKMTINKYTTIIVRAESHHFIEMAYKIFLDNWNPDEQNYKKLELKPKSKLNKLFSSSKVTTIDKLSLERKEELEDLLNEILLENIQKKKNFNKNKKQELALRFNLHPETINSYYSNLKKTYHKKRGL